MHYVVFSHEAPKVHWIAAAYELGMTNTGSTISEVIHVKFSARYSYSLPTIRGFLYGITPSRKNWKCCDTQKTHPCMKTSRLT
jgi:hypothetical protein